ncbi:MAG: four helix bundle protein [Saprospiraceae bacterium]|nr:four helix bundle protein [Saprospiraceae bacterium]
MKTGNVIQEKSYAFALKVVKLSRCLIEEKKEFVLSRQLLKSGTSIGALVEEAIGGQTSKDFYAKMTIAYKEARETRYWLRLLCDTDFIEYFESQELIAEVDELLKIIGSIQKTMKKKIENDE